MQIKPVLAKSDTVLKKHIHFRLSKFPKFGFILTFLQHQKIKGMPPARSQRDGRTVWRQELQKSVLYPLEPRLSLQEGTWLSSRASHRTAVLKTRLIPRELRLDHEDKVKSLCVVWLDEVRWGPTVPRQAAVRASTHQWWNQEFGLGAAEQRPPLPQPLQSIQDNRTVSLHQAADSTVSVGPFSVSPWRSQATLPATQQGPVKNSWSQRTQICSALPCRALALSPPDKWNQRHWYWLHFTTDYFSRNIIPVKDYEEPWPAARTLESKPEWNTTPLPPSDP